MCFAPQQRAFFRHRNFQKWSERDVFLAFSLANALRATTACNFSSLIWPDGSAPAALASLLFDPLEPQIIGKTQRSAIFLPFHASASSLFYSSLLSDSSDSSHLCFSSVHIVGSLTSKLPSNIPVVPHKAVAEVSKTRRRMARERRGAGSSLVSTETPYYKTIY